MANAPPTPPATTPIELQDEARSNAAAAASSSSTTATEAPPAPVAAPPLETRPEIYQSMIPAIIDSISRNDFERLARMAEEMDYQVYLLSLIANTWFECISFRPPAIVNRLVSWWWHRLFLAY